jgi:general secretion pathway protein G
MRFKPERLGGSTMCRLHVGVILLSVIASCDKGGHRGVAIESQRMTEAATALYLFRSAYGRFPTTEEGLRALVRPPSTEPFARSVPTDAWGNDYNYVCKAGQPVFRLWSNGPDEKPGGGDDIHWIPRSGKSEQRPGQE